MSSPVNNAFRFRQFEISQDKCSMKVSTDAILFGSWVNAQNAKSILDIGTGTGVLSLMMAQKNSYATIDAVEIDEENYLQAKENFLRSRWFNRIQIHHTSIQNFSFPKKFDAVVCNPPYFVNSLANPNPRKQLAKHTRSLSYADLVSSIDRLLEENGVAFLMIPHANRHLLEKEIEKKKFFINRTTEVFSVAGKPLPYLRLIETSRFKSEVHTTQAAIKNEWNEYTEAFRQLTCDFYEHLK